MRTTIAAAAAPLALLTCASLVAQKKLSYDDVRKPVRWEAGAPSASFVSGGRHVQYSGGWWSMCIDPATGDRVEPEREAATAAARRRRRP